MDWELFLEQVWGWVQAAQLPLIVLLVLVDVGLGVARAVKQRIFSWSKLGEFYRTNVVPYVIMYVVLYVAVEAARALEILPAFDGILGDGLLTSAFGVIVYNLGTSVRANVEILLAVLRASRV